MPTDSRTDSTEANLYWDLVSHCYRVSHLTPVAGMEIGRLLWEASGLLHFVPATSTEPGRLSCPGFPRRVRVLDADLSKQVVEGLIVAAKRDCGDDWKSYVEDFIGVSNGGAA